MNECAECEYYEHEEDVCLAFVCDGIDCPQLPCEDIKVIQLGFIENGTGKHQSNIVFDVNNISPTITTIHGGTQQIKILVED